MASEVTVRKLTRGFMVSTPRTMRDGVPVEEAFAEASRPAMIQRVLSCLGIDPAEAYIEAAKDAFGSGTGVVRIDPSDLFKTPDTQPTAYIAGFGPNEDGVIGPTCTTGVCGLD